MTALEVYRPDSIAQYVDPDPWATAAGDWLKNLNSDRTRTAYRDAWRGFLTFVDGKAPSDVTQGDVIDYRFHLKTAVSPKTGRPFAQSTVNQRLTALSSFYDFAKTRGLRLDNPVDGVTRESVAPYGKATWLDPEEGEDFAFLNAIDASTAQGKRDLAIMLLYMTNAFRVSELVSLSVDALRRQGRRLFITYRYKGGEVKEVSVADEAADALDAYLATRGELEPSAPLFVATDKGRRAAAAIGRYGDEEKALTTRSIRYLVKSYANKTLGPGHGIHPHSLRHTAARVAELEGANDGDISALLGHKNRTTTMIYLQATRKTGAKTTALLGRRYGNLLANE